MRLSRTLFAGLAATGLTVAVTAPAGATPEPTTTTYTVTQCLTDFDVGFWQTGEMLHGQGTLAFDVYRYDPGQGWVYFGRNTDTIWGLRNQVNDAHPMHGDATFVSTNGTFTGTWRAGRLSQGVSGVGQIVARSADGTLKLRTPVTGTLDASQYPPKCDSSVNLWVVTSH